MPGPHPRHLVVACLLVAGALTSVTVATPVAADTELDRARTQLAEETRTFAELRTEVDRTTTALTSLQDALLAARAELAILEEELAEAEAAHGVALLRADQTRAEVARRDAELDAHLARWSDGRARLRDQAVHAYKHGNGVAGEVLVRGVTAAGDWHEIAVTLTTVERLAEDGRAAVRDEAHHTREVAALRYTADAARAAAVQAARDASLQAERLSELSDAAAVTAEGIAADEAATATTLAQLEADTAARELLVAELQATVARLELDASQVFIPVQVDLDPFGPPPAWAGQLPGDGPRWAAAIEATAARHGIDGRLFAALVWSESGFNPGVVSHAGALGLAQLMPGTARGLGVDPHDPLQNLEGGARYLRTQLDTFGRIDLALAAYNAGPGRVHRAGGVPNIVETQVYVPRVLDRYEGLLG